MAATGEPGRDSAGLLERGEVVAAVGRLLDAARGGRGGALFIVGAAGLGKTTVVDYAISLARPRFTVGAGGGDRVEAVLPFGVIGQAFEGLLNFDPYAAGGGQLAEVSAPARLFEILRGVREAAVRPLFLAFDDLHWSDPDSLTAIHLLCRRLGSLPVALLATLRPWPADALTAAQELAAQGLAQVEYLAALSAGAAGTVLRARAGKEVPAPVIEQAIGRCGGNPLLLEQAAGELARIGRLSTERVVLSRFLAAGESGQRYVRAASVLGTRFRIGIAAKVAGISAPEATAELEGLFHSGLLRDAGQGWAAFTHALVRQAVYDDLASPVRTTLHAAAFNALVGQRVNPAEAAEHAVAAHLVGDSQAVATVTRAGREALAAGAVGTARAHLTAGVELAGEGAAPELLLDLGKALIAEGDCEAAIAIHQRLLGRPSLPPTMRIDVLGQLGQAAFHAGHVERAAASFEAAIDLAEDAHPELAPRALVDHAFQTWAHHGPRAALSLEVRGRELAGEQPTPLGVFLGGYCSYLVGDPHGLETIEAAIRNMGVLSAMPGSTHWVVDLASGAGAVLAWAERFPAAEQLLTDVLRTAERRCEPFIVFAASYWWADCLCRLGRLPEALALSERVLELGELVPITLPFGYAIKALVLVEMGHLQEAAPWCERLAAMAEGHSWYLVALVDHHRRGMLNLRQGHVDRAGDTFGQLEDLATGWGVLDPCCIPWAGDAITAYLAGDRDVDARRVIDRLAQCALPVRWPRVIAAGGRAALAERAGDCAAAQDNFDEALAHLEGLPMPLVRTQTLTDYGALLTRAGHPDRARPLLAEAVHLAEDCGAGWHAQRARVAWRRAGGRTRSRDPDELSPQEAAVATFARAGKSNREIADQLYLSVKTVETHLRHVYQKLGIRSRWQLAERTDLDGGRARSPYPAGNPDQQQSQRRPGGS